jgi:hypothetical protein
MHAQRFPAITALALATAALCLPTGAALAGPTYRSPPPKPASSRSATDNTRQTNYSIPPGAPLDRTYTWYAPPAGYEVVLEGTPSEPRTVTVVGPDGSSRTTRLEGPVVMRLHYYAVRERSR